MATVSTSSSDTDHDLDVLQPAEPFSSNSLSLALAMAEEANKNNPTDSRKHAPDDLQRYACMPDPPGRQEKDNEKHCIPNDVYLYHTPKTVVILDLYPKSKIHLLILPRPQAYPKLKKEDFLNLPTLLNKNKRIAKQVMEDLNEEAIKVKAQVEEEMMKRFKFKWGIWIGFHGNPSMPHIHLHVISADLVSPKMSNKKHYNTFSPKIGIFIKLKTVLEWFEAVPSFWHDRLRELCDKNYYKDLQKEDLQCFYEDCRRQFRTMPALREHLQLEFTNMSRRERERIARAKEFERRRAAREAKRKTPDSRDGSQEDGGEGSQTKKTKTNGGEEVESQLTLV
ncbi:HIT-like domain-containing protein [Abortiporus biennis]|nr:HIT-like domain-containing protein [Abortiporus biennis]